MQPVHAPRATYTVYAILEHVVGPASFTRASSEALTGPPATLG